MKDLRLKVVFLAVLSFAGGLLWGYVFWGS